MGLQYLHDKEEKDDDDNIDPWVNPHSRLAQAFGVTLVFYPRIVVKQSTDGFPGHQLFGEEAEGAGSLRICCVPFFRELIPNFIIQESLLRLAQGT